MKFLLYFVISFVLITNVRICFSNGEYAAGMTYGAISGGMMGYIMSNSKQCGIDDMPSYCKKTETIESIILTCPKSEIKKEDELIAFITMCAIFIFILVATCWLIFLLGRLEGVF